MLKDNSCITLEFHQPTYQPPVATVNYKTFNKVSQRQITANPRIKYLASVITKHRLTRVNHGILHSWYIATLNNNHHFQWACYHRSANIRCHLIFCFNQQKPWMKVRIHVILRRLSLKSVQILHFTHTYFLNTKPFKNQILFPQLIPTHGPLLRSVNKKERITKLQNFTNPPPSPTTAMLITIRSSENQRCK